MQHNKKTKCYEGPVLSPFQDLLEKKTGMGFQEDLIKYAKWAGIPPQFRKTESEKEFRRQNGISDLTFANLKRHPQFTTLIVEATSKWVIEQMPTVVGALTERVLQTADEHDTYTFVLIAQLLENIKRDRLL